MRTNTERQQAVRRMSNAEKAALVAERSARGWQELAAHVAEFRARQQANQARYEAMLAAGASLGEILLASYEQDEQDQ